MSVLRNLEAKLGGLVEGAFSRAFKSRVEPVELARKLAKEMEDAKTVSVSRVYVPNHYRVFLSPEDREQFASYEPALRKELSDYLLEHARAREPGTDQPPGGGVHDRRAPGRRRVRHPGAAARRSPRREEVAGEAAPSQGDFGHTMVYSPDRAARGARRRAGRSPRAPCSPAPGGGRCSSGGAGHARAQPRLRHRRGRRQRLAPPRRAARHARRLADRRPRLDERHQGEPPARRARPCCGTAIAITLGVTDLDFELE